MEFLPKTIAYEGKTYSIHHLHPKNWVLKLSCGKEIKAFIQFRSHCYTDSKPPASREALLLYDLDGNARYFCTKRYRLSRRLKSWFLNWSGEICFLSPTERGHQHWIVVESDEGEQVKVVFKITPNIKDDEGVMIVVKTVHAYEWTKPPIYPDDDHLPFSVLVKGTAERQKPVPRKNRGGV
ncbi:hypothetical protein C9933_01095 [Methylophaga nitratireducenticrescens]|nr:hypothetical protein C9933_01095 [Methylophaga nitratireducenticrescens]PTB98645.1 hypothetical protein C9993_06925 [Marinobacter sp. Z-F4-2]